MGKTIIQTIGPLYGEVVNGTVFGRPNGSVYVPSANRISIAIGDVYIAGPSDGRYYICNSEGVRQGSCKMIAESQDIANYMAWELSDDSDFTTSLKLNFPAGQFNISVNTLGKVTDDLAIVAGTTYYMRGALFSANGIPVAYSETSELIGVEI